MHTVPSQGAAIAGIIAIVLDLPLLYYIPGVGDGLILVAAALAIGAGFTEVSHSHDHGRSAMHRKLTTNAAHAQNKGLMIGALVMATLATVWMSFSSLGMLLAAGACDAVSDVVSDGVSCWGCDTAAKCGTGGCEWQTSYTDYNVVSTGTPNQNNFVGTESGGVIDAVCANGVTGKNVDTSNCGCNAAQVALGVATTASPHTGMYYCPSYYANDGYCDEPSHMNLCAAGTDAADCNSTATTDCNADCGLTRVDAPGQTWTNTGCSHEEHGDVKELNKFCDAVGLVTFLVVVELILMLCISIAGCCVACCDKDVDRGDGDGGGKDDDDSG